MSLDSIARHSAKVRKEEAEFRAAAVALLEAVEALSQTNLSYGQVILTTQKRRLEAVVAAAKKLRELL
jgi:hypothetical protein